ncbi:Heat shock 70 kDa protein 12B [Termitomyces sp. T112]|nr:Heat shock 70 kDa protein 12B [Termitomyces sp. T112]
MASTRSAYTGPSRRLVLAFDVGTTFSGISYSILDPGQVPEIRSVTKYPAQNTGDAKIPTVIYYDANGTPRAIGAEAMREGLHELVEDEGWVKVEWFKLLMRPADMIEDTQPLPTLPADKSVVDVFADFIRYLFESAKTYIIDAHPSGSDLWKSVESRIEFVLAHPNGWEGAQQKEMREAIVLAGLIPGTSEGHSRVQFVSEGEASLHFCVQSGLTTEPLKKGEGVLIVDAGGGTIDLSAYGQRDGSKDHEFEEISAPKCHLQGSVFVTRRARVFFENLLHGSRFLEDIEVITQHFDQNSKLTFRSIDEPRFIKFGNLRDRDLSLGIRSGQLRLNGSDVADFFEPSFTCIIQAIKEQRKNAQRPITSVFLVGGFAASEWLFSQLRTALEPLGLQLCRPDTGVNKAVAEGAISFYLDHSVAVRIAKYSYGVECTVLYEEHNREHRARSSRLYTSLTGLQRLPGYFDAILRKDVHVSETEEFRRSYAMTARNTGTLRRIEESIVCYRGTLAAPQWMDEDSQMYSTLCVVEADTSKLSQSLPPLFAGGDAPTMYYRMEYDIVLSFGLTELKAQIAWRENGEEKRTPARIIYDTRK